MPRFAIAWTTGLWLGLLQPIAFGGGAVRAATGVIVLDQPAIAAKAPDRVFLDAIVLNGKRLVAAGEHGVIIYSDDNGASWAQARVPVGVTLTALAFVTPQTGWAVGNYGVVLRTEDGGKTWSTKLTGMQIPALTLAAAKAAVASQSTVPGAAAALHRADMFGQQGPDKPFLTILAQSDQKAIAFGAFRIAFKTEDGGLTWQDWSLHIDDPVSHHLYSALQLGNSIYLAGETGLVFRSDDAGGEFKTQNSPSDATLFGIVPADKGVLVYGVGGVAYKSVDGGSTWQSVKVGDGGNLTAALQLNSGGIVLAEQSGKLFMSRDGGSSFAAFGMSLPMAVAGLVQAADGSLVAVGNRGVMRVLPNGRGPS